MGILCGESDGLVRRKSERKKSDIEVSNLLGNYDKQSSLAFNVSVAYATYLAEYVAYHVA